LDLNLEQLSELRLVDATIIEHATVPQTAGLINEVTVADQVSIEWWRQNSERSECTVFSMDHWRFELQGNVIFVHRTGKSEPECGPNQVLPDVRMFTIVLTNELQVKLGR
jgi:hypothetical protein